MSAHPLAAALTDSDVAGGGPHHAAYGFYGDDFTGATDTLAHLARAGHRTMLFLAPPSEARLAAAGPLDAVGIAGAARAMAPTAMADELARVGARFAELGVRILHYKVCSTFDSAPATGNIATAIATLRRAFANPFVPIVGGQPGLQRYCVFGQLFAAAGSDTATIHRLDRHPTMSQHPVTPMDEADLRVHLGRQGLHNVASVDWRAYALPFEALDALIDARLAEHPSTLLFDVLRDDDLRAIGRVLHMRSRHAPLVAVGPSSVAQAWVSATAAASAHDSNITQDTTVSRHETVLAHANRPVFALAGSLSPTTAMQIEAARSYWKVELDPVVRDGVPLRFNPDTIIELLKSGRNVLAFTTRRAVASSFTASASSVSSASCAASEAFATGEQIAKACAALLCDVVNAAQPARIGIAGGDTSSYAVKALGAWGLSYRAALGAGVTVCRLHADCRPLDGIEVMLKGGQMGGVDLFERLITG